MAEIGMLADVIQTYGVAAWAALMTVLYIAEQRYSRRRSDELVAHSTKLGAELSRATTSNENMASLLAKVSEGAVELKVASDNMRDEAGRMRDAAERITAAGV